MNNTISNYLYDAYNGFIRGNLFKNLYTPYKNYTFKELRPSNEREEMLYTIQMYNFAAHDLNLYLDIYQNDNEAIKLFNQYQKLSNQITREYEKKYGAINLNNEVLNTTPWSWDNAPWPWEVQ